MLNVKVITLKYLSNDCVYFTSFLERDCFLQFGGITVTQMGSLNQKKKKEKEKPAALK